MKKSSKNGSENKRKGNDSSKKEIYYHKNITMTEKDLKNFEILKDKLPPNNLSSMFRYFLKTYVDNPESFTRITLPDKLGNKSIEENIKLLKQLIPQERKEMENRLTNLEGNQQEILNLLKKLLAIQREKDPEKVEKIMRQVNGLGGKI